MKRSYCKVYFLSNSSLHPIWPLKRLGYEIQHFLGVADETKGSPQQNKAAQLWNSSVRGGNPPPTMAADPQMKGKK